MLDELCGYLRNWFERAKFIGHFKIENGVITSFNDGDMGLLDGQYIRIIGSILNDGVYEYHAEGIEGLRDEEFNGAVWGLAIPKAVLDLADEIDAWQAKYGGADSAAMSPYASESFGGYSYTKSAGNTENSASGLGGWQNAFASRLSQWRKI